MSKIQPAQRVLMFSLPAGASYVDLASALSAVNRRAYRQGMQYAIDKVVFTFNGHATASFVGLSAYTAGSTWVVHNAWKKAQAHWLAQQREARSLIGQSAKPAYEDFKIYLDDSQRSGTTNAVIASDGGAVSAGEWDYSRFVWEADDNSIDEPYVHLIGGNVSTTDWGLILNYEQSRATVQAEDPALPAEYSTNMYALMATDENLVADEVAQNMESDNDNPPYDQDDYPGNDANADAPWLQESAAASVGAPLGVLSSFVAQCGLVKFNTVAFAADGNEVTAPTIVAAVHLVPGSYKGVMAEPMGQ